METDGAQDYAPCYPKTFGNVVDLFYLLGLGVLLRGVNAGVLSAFITVEQRMSPLFHDLIGITLPHNYFDNHIDSSRKTIHREMEVKISKGLLKYYPKFERKPLFMGRKLEILLRLYFMDAPLEDLTFQRILHRFP